MAWVRTVTTPKDGARLRWSAGLLRGPRAPTTRRSHSSVFERRRSISASTWWRRSRDSRAAFGLRPTPFLIDRPSKRSAIATRSSSCRVDRPRRSRSQWRSSGERDMRRCSHPVPPQRALLRPSGRRRAPGRTAHSVGLNWQMQHLRPVRRTCRSTRPVPGRCARLVGEVPAGERGPHEAGRLNDRVQLRHDIDARTWRRCKPAPVAVVGA